MTRPADSPPWAYATRGDDITSPLTGRHPDPLDHRPGPYQGSRSAIPARGGPGHCVEILNPAESEAATQEDRIATGLHLELPVSGS
jgi:hypothetical protein